MSSEGAEPGQAREESKLSKRPSQWRHKIKAAASLSKANKPSQLHKDQDVNDFLGTSFTGASQPQPLAPRIDTSPPVSKLGISDEPLEYGRYASPAPPTRKRPIPEGTHVSFENHAPKIIGEGGEEAEAPTKDVMKEWVAAEHSYSTNHNENHETNLPPPPELLQIGLNPNSRRSSVQRAPTRHTTGEWALKRRSMNTEEGLVQAYKAELDKGRRQAESQVREPSLSDSEPTIPNLQPTLPLLQEPTLPVLQPTLPNIEPSAKDKSSGEAENSDSHSLDRQSNSNEIRTASQGGVGGTSRSESTSSRTYQPASYQASRRAAGNLVANASTRSAFVPYNPSRQSASESLTKAASLKPSVKTEEVPFRQTTDNSSQSTISPADLMIPPTASKIELGSGHEQALTNQAVSRSKALPEQDSSLLLPLAKNGGIGITPEAASEELYSRIQHQRGMFRLTAERFDTSDKGAVHWLRACTWWFLRGKSTLESSLRNSNQALEQPGSRPSSRGGEAQLPQNKQCFVDLAKAWWIMEEVLPDMLHLQTAEHSGTRDKVDRLNDAQLLDVVEMIRKDMQLFAVSLHLKNFLPPYQLVVQGADPEIWLPYPKLPPGVFALTANLDPRTLSKVIPHGQQAFFPILTSDTARFFSYGRVFGEVELVNDVDNEDELHFPSLISIARDRTSPRVEFLITSQDGQISIHVQSDPHIGPTWGDIDWRFKTHSIRIRLARKFEVVLRLWEADFKTLWGIQDYNRRVEADRHPKENEELLFSNQIDSFHYIPAHGMQSGFSPTPVKSCKIKIYQRNILVNDGSGQRSVYNGYRVVAVTPPYVKTLSSISRTIGEVSPILVTNLRGDDGAPAMLVSVQDSGKKASIIFAFDNALKREELRTILAGIATSPDECYSGVIPLDSMSLARVTNSTSTTPDPTLPLAIQWQNLRVINQGRSLEHAPSLFSNRLRVCVSSNYGSITDRINMGEALKHIQRFITDTKKGLARYG